MNIEPIYDEVTKNEMTINEVIKKCNCDIENTDGACTCIDGCKCFLKQRLSDHKSPQNYDIIRDHIIKDHNIYNEIIRVYMMYGLMSVMASLGIVWYICCK
jgi:hypothetical protein